MYISPFRQQRKYSENGIVTYLDVEQRTELTGIRMFDAYLQYLAHGGLEMQTFADRHGLRLTDIDSMVFVLTGMRGIVFCMKYQVRLVDELLRYTDMTVAEVAKRFGIGSANNLYLTYKREFNLAPGYRRMRIRQEGDLGRFRL